MSIKKYFEVAESIQSLANKSSKDTSGEIESTGYHEQDIIKEERYVPYTDFKKPENFARWGSAEEYYESAIKRIYGTYPYDGSLKERLEWENDSTYLDLYLLKDRYPRTNGYIILSADSAAVSQVNDGYGRPSTPEYIFLRGGPNPSTGPSATLAGQFTGSNFYEPLMNRASNLQYDLTSRGTSLEFWLKKDGFSDPSVTSREVIFDMWNGQASSSADYGRLRVELSASGDSVEGASPILLTVLSGTQGFQRQSVAASTFTTASIADGNWHHYAITMKTVSTPSAGVETRFYVDGTLNNTVVLGSKAIDDISTPGLSAHIGALVAPISGGATPSSTAAGDGKLSGSLDEFRYWKTQRTSKDIGRYWFTQVGGGVNTDPKPYITTQELANVNLGVYFKFNEGITGIASTDSTVLDYSGRYSNGTWTGYNTNSRNTGSAIVSSSAATHEFLDPIIYVSHPKVQELKTELQLSGSYHDVNNNAAIYNSIPAWITEEDSEGTKNVKYLTQILGSYFDTLHLQIENLNAIGNRRYITGSIQKPIPFAEKLLSSTGMVAPNLFLDADVLEKLGDRSEDRVYAMSLHDIKNTIYQNIYNNISYIYKSKGTEKAFRNLIRCFGIDDELVKSNMYASNVEYELRNNRRNTVVTDKYVDFNTEDNQVATVFNYPDSANANSVGFITSSTNLTGGFSTTLETEVFFPLKPADDLSMGFFSTNVISSSLFGMHGAMPHDGNDTTWLSNTEACNFQVYAVRDEIESDNVKFVLTGTTHGYVPSLKSDLYEEVYNNSKWSLSVRIRPEQYPVKGIVDGANSNYVVELHGVHSQAGEIMEQFTVSGSVSSAGLPAAFVTGSRRAYIGAHRTNLTGNLLQSSDVKVSACRYWLDYVDDEALAGHVLDTENHGAAQPHLYAFPFQTSASFGDVKKFDTLVFNWEFLTNTGSNASGYMTIPDISSGSTPKTGFDTAFSIGNLLDTQHTAQGRFFPASSTTAIDKDFVMAARLNLPENVQSEDMVKVLNAQEQDVFTGDSRPTNYFFAFEKSMYQVISEEMINYFANLKDFNNLIGDQVERYRPDYKQMGFMRQKFFEQVGNDSLDFDKFYEFYKWFDSALSLMLGQLVPASADFSDNVRTIIEDHVLERPKYQQKFPFLQRKGGSAITSSVDGNMAADSSMMSSPEEFAQGTAFFTNTAMTKRQIGSSNTSQNRPWRHFRAPPDHIFVDPGWPPESLSFTYANPIEVDQHVDIGSSATWDALIGGSGTDAKAFSLSAWIYPTTLGADGAGTIISFSNNDRVVNCHSSNPGANNGRLFFYMAGASYGDKWSDDGALIFDTWTHIIVTYEGGTAGDLKMYLNGSEQTATAQTSISNPSAIDSDNAYIGARDSGSGVAYEWNGNLCDVAVWDKELTAADAVQIYSLGTRAYLAGPPVESYPNLLSWWRMGSDPRDTYNGTIYDQVGGRNGTPTNLGADAITTESPDFREPYGWLDGIPGLDGLNPNRNMYWHRYLEARSGSALPAGDAARQSLFASIRDTFDRRVNSPVKLAVEGYTAIGGVGRHHNFVANYVFEAAAAWGRTVGTNAPVNILLAHSGGVEKLLGTLDEYYPTFKQRLGFKLNPGANSGKDNAFDGNMYAPFSLYSSSVTTAYNAEVVSNFTGNVEITNLHHDFVAGTDIPMQGPFTEKYVGGRQYRHTALNKGSTLDTVATRAEGFRIQFNDVTASGGGTFKNSLAIVPPNSLGGGTDVNLPTAYRMRDVAAKRPVNIKNIRMTTGSTVIGNYEKNYQVVSTAGRMLNDPFFKDQSFDFALYPETLATRGRFPLGRPWVWDGLTKTANFNGTSTTIQFGDDAYYESMPALNDANWSISFWVYGKTISANDSILRLGLYGGGVDNFEVIWYGGPLLYCNFQGQAGKLSYITNATNLSADTWYHVVYVLGATAAQGGGGGATYPKIYINGSDDSSTVNRGYDANYTTPPDFGAIGLEAGVSRGGTLGSNRFDGNMCDLAIWDGVLSSDDVSLLYNSGNRIDVSTLTLAAGTLSSYWMLGEGPNPTVWDGISDSTAKLSNKVAAYAYLTGTGSNLTLPTTSPNAPAAAAASFEPPDPYSTPNPGGALNYEIPARTGSTSQKTVFVNRFAGSGYEVMSLGYMDPAHEELSVYNASPYHNLMVIDYGISGSASVDPTLANTIRVQDQLDKVRGLDQRATLHAGQYGTDAAYGAINVGNTRVDGGLGYPVTPSWHKTNKNRRRRMENASTAGDYPAAANYTGSTYDNLFVQHAIPRSEAQYAWITGSMIADRPIFGLDRPSCFSASTLSQLETGSQHQYFDNNYLTNYAGMNDRLTIENVNTDTHMLSSSPALGWSTGYFNGSSNKMVIGTMSYTPWNAVVGDDDADAKAFTFAAWIRMPPEADGAASEMIIALGGYSRRFWWNNNTIKADIGGTTDGRVTSPPNTILPGLWHHVAFSFAGGDPGGSATEDYMKLYIDGVQQTVTVLQELDGPDVINESAGNNSNIGAAKASDYYFNGYMTEVAIFDAELTAADILEIYNLRKPKRTHSINDSGVSNLVGYWRFDPDLGDSTSAVINRASAPVANTDGAGTIAHFANAASDGWSTVGNGMGADKLNLITNNRNGPYGWPTWKQIRAGEGAVARNLRKNSIIGTVVPPPKIADTIGGREINFVVPTQPISFVDFYEAPIESSNNPIYFYFEDNTENSDSDNNIILTVPYGNRFEYFSNPGLNNYLGLQIDMDKETAYDAVVDFAVSSSLSLKVEYSQRIYPSMVNTYNDIVRARTTFSIADIWAPHRLDRSPISTFGIGAYGETGSQGQLIASASIWPLDAQLPGPQGQRASAQSLTSSITASDGAGELMNFYSRYANRNTGSAYQTLIPRPFINLVTQSYAAPTYASRVPAGCAGNDTIVENMVLAGAPPWVAPQQAGKDPYKNYTTYSEQIRKAAKDYSIVPEYRVSPLMDLYVNRTAGDFLSTAAEFDLTGAAYANSSVDKFYRTYSNSDFLKYFKYVDEDLNDQRSGDLKVVRDSVSLSCEAFVKFLPYKGFYPAERTLELATILSKSFGPQLAYNPNLLGSSFQNYRFYFNPRSAYRIFLEPLMSPGILFNTIKSGIACSNFVLTEGSPRRNWTTATALQLPTASQTYPETSYPETQGNNGLYYGLNPNVVNQIAGPARPPWAGASGSAARILSLGSSSSGSYTSGENDSHDYMLRKMPFEAIYRPTQYFNANFIGGDGRSVVSIYDTAASGTSAWIPTWCRYTISVYNYGFPWQSSILMGMPPSYRTSGLVDASPELGGGEDYTLAIDNFLCESMNMFVDGGASLVSARQENFQDQVEGRIYTGVVKLFRTPSSSAGTTEPFEMYSRASAFGTPLDANTRKTAKPGTGDHETDTQGISFSHVTPPYFAGESYVTLTYTASYNGRPDLDDIFAQMTSSYYRDEYVPNLNAASAVERGTNEDIRMQIKDSVNLFTKIHEVPEGTNTQKSRWLIQPKFETPILNFTGLSTGSAMVPSYTRTAATASANQITTRGMWHQYGSVISSSNAGVFLSCLEKPYIDPPTDGIHASSKRHSLWDLVGMPSGKNERIGNPKNEFLLEEAVVAVPFKTVRGARQFISFPTRSRTYNYKTTRTWHALNAAMNKYVFPPIFDFIRFDTVDPVLMYVFEFSAKLNQKDITDIWQNLPPDVAERFEVQNAVVEEKELIDSIISKNHDIEWMVFKVKKRAKKDFEKFRRSLVSEADLSAFPDTIRSPLTYNWPYDYCSLVELAKIEEAATYVSTDLKKNAPLTPLEELNIERITFVDEASPEITRVPTRRRRRPPRRRRGPRRPPRRGPAGRGPRRGPRTPRRGPRTPRRGPPTRRRSSRPSVPTSSRRRRPTRRRRRNRGRNR